jgi:hypothetical protein
MDFANELENSIAEEYGKEVNDPEIKEVGKEMQKILNKARAGVETIQAKRLGTLHANKKMVPRGKYKDTEAYQTAYNTALNKTSQKDDVINSQQGEGKTRQEKKLSIEEKLAAGRVFREPLETANRRIIFDNDDEAEILQQEIDSINLSMPDFGDFENFDVDTELAKAGLTRIERILKQSDFIKNLFLIL